MIHPVTPSIGLIQREATHTTQRHFAEMEGAVKDFIAMMKVKVEGRNPDDILNLDQMPIPFLYNSNKMLKTVGSKTIQARSSTSDTKRVMLAATVSASGKMLRPCLIFKGSPHGRIAQCEFVTFPVE